MKWLKFILTSFFEQKEAKEGADRSFWNVLLGLFVTLIILTAFFSAGYIYSFSTHYSSASEFKAMTYNAFANETIEDRVNLKFYKDGDDVKAITVNQEYANDTSIVINTFDEPTSKYKVNDYNLIIDTRSSANAYVDIADCIKYYNSKDTTNTLTADEYRTSPSQSDYTVELDFADKQLVMADLSDTKVDEYATWIDSYITSLNDETKTTNWNTIKSSKDTDRAAYNDSVYKEYVADYYSITVVPTVLTYYQYKFAVLDENNNYKYTNYLLITDTWCLISFTNDKGINLTYDGYYNELENGFIVSNTSNKNDVTSIQNNVDTIIAAAFTSVSGYKALYTGFSVLRFMLYVIIALILLGLFMFCLCKIRHRTYGDTYVGSFKIVSSFLMMSAALAGILTLIVSFFLSNEYAFSLGAWSLLGILATRTFVFIIIEEIAYKKNPLRDQVVTTSSSSDDKPVDLAPLNINTSDTGVKIIKNDKVSDDDEERMEFM